MVKLKFISIVMVLSLMAGCGSSSVSTSNYNADQRTQSAVGSNVQSTTQKASAEQAKPTPVPTPTPVPSPSPTPTPVSVQNPSPRNGTVEKLNTEVLDKLDNTKNGWWEVLNNEHKTPGFPPEANMVAKYDGIYVGDTSKKVIYLTFDEGYENGYTSKILDTLKENQVKAIFFITGAYLKDRPDLVKRMIDEGHQVGNHSINHPSMPTVSYSTFEKEILDLERDFSAKFGKGMKYFRPPMGEYSERTMAATKQLGYKTAFWSFHYLDYDVNNQKGTEYAYNKVMTNLHNGAVLLLHAVSKDNTEALDRIIKDAKAQGYTFSPFDL